MEKKAILKARAALERMKEIAKRVPKKMDPDAPRDDFEAFVGESQRIYNAFYVGSNSNGKSRAFMGRRKSERSKDELLTYIHQARHAEEHGIEAIAIPQAALGMGDMRIREIVYDGNGVISKLDAVHPDGRPVKIEDILEYRVILVPVTNFGRTYPVPTSHLGQPLVDPSPREVCALVIAHHEAFIAEAETYVVP